MAFDAFRDEEEEQDTGQGPQSSYVSFKNPGHSEVDVDPEETANRQEYFDALHEIRDELGSDGLKMLVGEFMAGAVEADEGDAERLEQLFQNLTQ